MKGEGFVRPHGGDPTAEAPAFPAIGEEYIRQIVELENRNQALAAQTADMSEGLTAFVERRPAQFGGG